MAKKINWNSKEKSFRAVAKWGPAKCKMGPHQMQNGALQNLIICTIFCKQKTDALFVLNANIYVSYTSLDD